MRQLKFIPSIMEVIKKVYTCPKHEIKFMLKSLEGISRLLVIFSGQMDNRSYMMITNRLIPLCDLILWILSKSPKVIHSVNYLQHLFNILTIHIKHRL